MLSPNTEVIEYTTAERLASIYRDQVAKIRAAIEIIGDSQEALAKAFGDGYHFSLAFRHMGHETPASREGWERIEHHFHLAAWRAILEKTKIRKVMSSKSAAKLESALNGRDEHNNPTTATALFPPITPESIMSVVAGYASSAIDFLEEAIHEEYDFWRPWKRLHDYKRNSEFKLNKRIIRPYMVTPRFGGGYHLTYSDQSQHVTALDNIFHVLDGKKALDGYRGPLADAINASGRSGTGETEYFWFKCHKNGNLHLTFKRLDLLAHFNKIAGRNRLPSPSDHD